MISKLGPATRMTLVRGFMAGIRGGVDIALRSLEVVTRSIEDTSVDALAIMVLKAQLLYLDRRNSEAKEVFDMNVRPRLEELAPETALLLSDNGILISQALLSPDIEEFYHLADQRRLLGMELWDASASARIDKAARDGKHYEALPICWQQLLRAYESLCWRRILLAELDMARECLALGWPHEAAYHGMLACNSEFISLVGQRLADEKTHDAVRKTLDQILPASQLTRHAAVAARLLEMICDVIPQDRLTEVVNWLTSRTRHVPSSPFDPSLFEPTWNAVGRLAPRLTPEQALQFIDIAFNHPWCTNAAIHRQHLLNTVNACVGRVNIAELPKIAERALPLAQDNKSDIDFTHAINLLCHLATRGGDQLRERLKLALYPPGQATGNTVLVQVARHFGASIKSRDQLDRAALRTADNLRLQVQRLGPGEKPAKLGGWGTVSKPLPNESGQLVAHIGGAEHSLGALVEHREQLSEQPLEYLVSAVLDMIANSDNLIENRVSLVQSLRRLLDHVSSDSAQRAAAILRPLAAGQITESQVGMSHAEATNPLNPFKMGSGDPADLRGTSLKALAEIEKRCPGTVEDLHEGILLQAMTDANPRVRAHSFAAARLASHLTHEGQFAALFGTADSDPKAAATALSVFLDIGRLHLEPTTWAMLAQCLERTRQSNHADIRQVTADVVRRASASEVPSSVAASLNELQNVLLGDVSFAVRSAAQKSND
jgi:hypothetical protein